VDDGKNAFDEMYCKILGYVEKFQHRAKLCKRFSPAQLQSASCLKFTVRSSIHGLETCPLEYSSEVT
jgi:hypothetical protein